MTSERFYEVEILKEIIIWSWSDPALGIKELETTPSPSPWPHDTGAGHTWIHMLRNSCFVVGAEGSCPREFQAGEDASRKKGLQRPFCSSCLISAERQAGHSGDISWVATMSLPTCFRFYVRKTKHSHTNVLKNIHIVSKHPLKVLFAEHLLQICQAIIHHRGYI